MGEKILAFAPIEPFSTNPILRELMALNGAQLVYRPKILPQHLLKDPQWQYWEKIKNLRKLRTPSGKKIYDGIQIIARPGDPISAVIKFIDQRANQFGISFIDLNFCCPGYKVLPKQRGGDLLKKPNTIIKVISMAIQHTSLPISIKIRKGYSNSDNPSKLCALIKKEFGNNIAWIVINRAPVKMYNVDFSEINKDFKPFQQAIEAVEGVIPIIANGAISNYEDIELIHKNAQVNGFMIGRSALGNARIFVNISKISKISKSNISDQDVYNNRIYSEFEKLFKIISKYQKGPSGRFCTIGEIKKLLFYYIKHHFESQNMQIPSGYGFTKWNERRFSQKSLIEAIYNIFPMIPKEKWEKWMEFL